MNVRMYKFEEREQDEMRFFLFKHLFQNGQVYNINIFVIIKS